MNRIFVYSGLIALVVSAATISIFNHFKSAEGQKIQIEHVSATPSATAVYTLGEDGEVVPLDFTRIAQSVTDAVVHIKATQAPQRSISRAQPFNPNSDRFRGSPFDDFFGPFFFREPNGQGGRGPSQARVGTGSGVIINSDGYIVTNNHVIADADDLEVTLHDNRTYKAVTIGTDPTTDLALLQIKEKNLPSLPLVDSDEVKVGEWVMAVGNPFNLTSTVTAGIVSAKGRSINILQEQFAVESFIQTDAAINPGNSGGALVNLAGGLIGINTAIINYAQSIGFSIPSNMVKHVVEQLVEHGEVHRGWLGVGIDPVSEEVANRAAKAQVGEGVIINSIFEGDPADMAGLKVGDIILKIGGSEIDSPNSMIRVIGAITPGQTINLDILRKGEHKLVPVKLESRKKRTTQLATLPPMRPSGLGFTVVNSTKGSKLPGGALVSRVTPESPAALKGLQSGDLIVAVNGEAVENQHEFDGLVGKIQKGSPVFLLVWRNDKKFHLGLVREK